MNMYLGPDHLSLIFLSIMNIIKKYLEIILSSFTTQLIRDIYLGNFLLLLIDLIIYKSIMKVDDLAITYNYFKILGQPLKEKYLLQQFCGAF